MNSPVETRIETPAEATSEARTESTKRPGVPKSAAPWHGPILYRWIIRPRDSNGDKVGVLEIMYEPFIVTEFACGTGWVLERELGESINVEYHPISDELSCNCIDAVVSDLPCMHAIGVRGAFLALDRWPRLVEGYARVTQPRTELPLHHLGCPVFGAPALLTKAERWILSALGTHYGRYGTRRVATAKTVREVLSEEVDDADVPDLERVQSIIVRLHGLGLIRRCDGGFERVTPAAAEKL